MAYRGPVWRPRRVPTPSPTPVELRSWLEESGSLTRRLREACGSVFRVRRLTEQWDTPWFDEARRLRIAPRRRVWIREVQLCCGGMPWVQARTVVPLSALNGPFRRLTRLGERPLGGVLFGRYPVRRGPIEVARLTPDDRLHRAVAECTNGGPPPDLWARRSVFRIAGRRLLVTEVFVGHVPHAEGPP